MTAKAAFNHEGNVRGDATVAGVQLDVGSQISGNILKLYADFNSLVKSNQVVAQLDPATFQATVHQTEGDLANAAAEG